MHREKGQVEADEEQPEVPRGQPFVGQPAGEHRFGILRPRLQSGEGLEQRVAQLSADADLVPR